MAKIILLTLIITLMIFGKNEISAHTYHSGDCPSVEPANGFDMKQFLGIWYAIQKTSTASTCIIYNITRGEEPGEYNIEQISQHFALGLTPLKHEYKYTGQLTVDDRAVPAKMTVKYPLSVGGSSTFTVFMTDYTEYAGIFSCQKLAFAHRQSATILSRTKTLDRIYVDKVRTRLSSYSVDPFDLSIVSQNGCPKDPKDNGVNINIDTNTFSKENIASVLRKAGEKIGDGVEYVTNAGRKLYNKLTEDKSKDDTKAKMLAAPTTETEAEWIPF